MSATPATPATPATDAGQPVRRATSAGQPATPATPATPGSAAGQPATPATPARLVRFASIRPIFPVLAAEMALWLGFGALLPILPLYITGQGIDAGTLGLIVAAWPASRLFAEPIFGWIADRRDRRTMMLFGLLGTAVVAPLPLVFTGAPAFLLLRALAGVATAAYDPAARGYLMDAVPVEERAHAFGLYGTAQMSGFLLGPAFGAVGAAIFGGYGFPFVFCSIALVGAAVLLVAGTRRRARTAEAAAEAAGGQTVETAETAESAGSAAAAEPAAAAAAASRLAPAEPASRLAPAEPVASVQPTRLANRLLAGAMIINMGMYFASGTYEVIWSLWMRSLGADLGLIGLSFAAFGIGVAVLSPFAGRMIDRTGPLRFVVVGALAVGVAGLTYPLLTDPWIVIAVSVLEGAGLALAGPALYTLVGRATPRGRASTAQGLFGAAGTLGFILASLVAGILFAIDVHLPFYVFVGGLFATLLVGLGVGGRLLLTRAPAWVAVPSAGAVSSPGAALSPGTPASSGPA